MLPEKDRNLFAPLFLFLWAGYLFFGAYYQIVRHESFFWASPIFSAFVQAMTERLSLAASSCLAMALGLLCAGAGLWMALREGDRPPED